MGIGGGGGGRHDMGEVGGGRGGGGIQHCLLLIFTIIHMSIHYSLAKLKVLNYI